MVGWLHHFEPEEGRINRRCRGLLNPWQLENREEGGRGQNIPVKVTHPVTYVLQQGPTF
jgi:hypothetical protein